MVDYLPSTVESLRGGAAARHRAELSTALDQCREHLRDPERFTMYTVAQVWGRKSAGAVQGIMAAIDSQSGADVSVSLQGVNKTFANWHGGARSPRSRRPAGANSSRCSGRPGCGKSTALRLIAGLDGTDRAERSSLAGP